MGDVTSSISAQSNISIFFNSSSCLITVHKLTLVVRDFSVGYRIEYRFYAGLWQNQDTYEVGSERVESWQAPLTPNQNDSGGNTPISPSNIIEPPVPTRLSNPAQYRCIEKLVSGHLCVVTHHWSTCTGTVQLVSRKATSQGEASAREAYDLRISLLIRSLIDPKICFLFTLSITARSRIRLLDAQLSLVCLAVLPMRSSLPELGPVDTCWKGIEC